MHTLRGLDGVWGHGRLSGLQLARVRRPGHVLGLPRDVEGRLRRQVRCVVLERAHDQRLGLEHKRRVQVPDVYAVVGL